MMNLASYIVLIDLLVIVSYVAVDEKQREKERETTQSIISANSIVYREKVITYQFFSTW